MNRGGDALPDRSGSLSTLVSSQMLFHPFIRSPVSTLSGLPLKSSPVAQFWVRLTGPVSPYRCPNMSSVVSSIGDGSRTSRDGRARPRMCTNAAQFLRRWLDPEDTYNKGPRLLTLSSNSAAPLNVSDPGFLSNIQLRKDFCSMTSSQWSIKVLILKCFVCFFFSFQLGLLSADVCLLKAGLVKTHWIGDPSDTIAVLNKGLHFSATTVSQFLPLFQPYRWTGEITAS